MSAEIVDAEQFYSRRRGANQSHSADDVDEDELDDVDVPRSPMNKCSL